MRKAVILILSLSLLLCACGDSKTDVESLNALTQAVASTNSEPRFSGQYMIEINFGKGVTLYYALGDLACDREEKKASVIFSQTYLGVSANAENYVAHGKAISVDNGSASEAQVDTDALFGKFPYCSIFDIPEKPALTVTENTLGTSYSFVSGETERIFSAVIGDDIYELATVLKQPQRDKTEYGEAQCVYTVKDGRVLGVRYEFDVKLFDTPAYVPGYSVPESDYTVELHIVAKLTYENFGDQVEIKEYNAKDLEISS
ncbi:MAG: hypothetical protein J6Q72_04285 [Clostridia bacterium]|nr:hypothetical protein [Clostridia bacterium]